ncbi:hypothetical protein SAMD00019534_047650 [Acytostelium subglobosum LB1]|uniref:hypothetical protein n=1 Tax=Acytostelium subglobosum LB1 TaxID=1410327 RepID=UPI0006448847|nr:hypothetical protein SAMD00019534_047650 [Acytostelium subglobosum LB1]GAM21590.1 hypothetical protein SAMD00019534_047650 [Acytostelium subglobosum LB1]|eukprot:XP_012755709.1 hypothetical protein SAMD00019534_047650 [Acytostelium subglobosum LB1]
MIDSSLDNFITTHWLNQRVDIVVAVTSTKDQSSLTTSTSSSTTTTTTSKKPTLAQTASASLILDTELAPFFAERLSKESNMSDAFYHIETPLDLLLSQQFINDYIKPGGFTALTQYNRLDDGNVVAFIPNGKVLLNVDKDTYQQLGLTGQHSHFSKTKPQRYVITLDCRSKEMMPDSSLYKRVIWCLKDRVSSISMIVSSIDPSTGHPRPIKFPAGVNVKRVVNIKKRSYETYRVPVVPALNGVDKAERIEFMECWNEALGLVLCGLNEDKVVLNLNAALTPESSRLTDCFVASTEGMVTPQSVLSLIRTVRRIMTNKKVAIDWVSIQVTGFQDTPVTWANNEHGYHINGDNNYSIILHPNNEYWTLATLGHQDTFS